MFRFSLIVILGLYALTACDDGSEPDEDDDQAGDADSDSDTGEDDPCPDAIDACVDEGWDCANDDPWDDDNYCWMMRCECIDEAHCLDALEPCEYQCEMWLDGDEC